jgi:hypothetical protein
MTQAIVLMNHFLHLSRRRAFAIAAIVCVLLPCTAVFSQDLPSKQEQAQAAQARLQQTVEYLASESMEGRGVGTRGLDAAADSIAKQFRDLGLKANLLGGSYFQPLPVRAKKNPDSLHFSLWDTALFLGSEAFAAFSADNHPSSRKKSAELPLQLLNRTTTIKNVVAVLDGEGANADQLLVIGAHYDHLGVSEKPAGKRAIYPGANDNASGVAVLLETARILAERPHKLPRRIVFVAFSGEESGLLGSFYYVNHPPAPLRKTIAMIDLDMVGQFRNRPITVFGTRTSSALAESAEKVFADHRINLAKVPFAWAGSDHMPFYANRIPVAFFHTAGGWEHYHQPSDKPETLDYAGMVPIAQSTADLAVALAEMDPPPRFSEDGLFNSFIQTVIRCWGHISERLG